MTETKKQRYERPKKWIEQLVQSAFSIIDPRGLEHGYTTYYVVTDLRYNQKNRTLDFSLDTNAAPNVTFDQLMTFCDEVIRSRKIDFCGKAENGWLGEYTPVHEEWMEFSCKEVDFDYMIPLAEKNYATHQEEIRRVQRIYIERSAKEAQERCKEEEELKKKKRLLLARTRSRSGKPRL